MKISNKKTSLALSLIAAMTVAGSALAAPRHFPKMVLGAPVLVMPVSTP